MWLFGYDCKSPEIIAIGAQPPLSKYTDWTIVLIEERKRKAMLTNGLGVIRGCLA